MKGPQENSPQRSSFEKGQLTYFRFNIDTHHMSILKNQLGIGFLVEEAMVVPAWRVTVLYPAIMQGQTIEVTVEEMAFHEPVKVADVIAKVHHESTMCQKIERILRRHSLKKAN